MGGGRAQAHDLAAPEDCREHELLLGEHPPCDPIENADITELENLRKRYAGDIESAGGKLTITSIAVKVLASAVKVFPNFAASLDMGNGEIVLKKYCHVGVAVDTDRGLIVPVIRDADRKNILELSIELSQLAEKARSKTIRLEDLEGAVITVTNLGGIGGTQFTPIIHAPEVAILGLSRSRYESVLVDGRFEPRLIPAGWLSPTITGGLTARVRLDF